MVNLTVERDYDDYSYYALRYSMISTGVADYARSMPMRPSKKSLRFFESFRESGYERFRAIMTRASGMTDIEFSSSLTFFKSVCRRYDERNSKKSS